jgi:DNA-binding NarL/FixJ family response regulator
MPNVLVTYEKPSWQRNIQALLSRQTYVNVSYATLGLGERKLPRSRFDVVIVECGRDKSRLRDSLSSVRRLFPKCRIILVLERLGISDFAFGHNMGISAVLDEGASSQQVLAALDAALRGDLYVAAPILKRRGSQASYDMDSSSFLHDQLSEREGEVLALVARGFSNKAIAKSLYISEKTVKNHLYSIFRKIGVSDRTKAALYAVKGLSSQKYGPYAPLEVFYEVDEHQ